MADTKKLLKSYDQMPNHSLLLKYRRIMDRIYDGGNIYYDKDRMDAYGIIAVLASDFRRSLELKSGN